MSISIISELTPTQYAAATSADKLISTTAGPGSGKTRVLVARYLHLLADNPIETIIAVTFTTKAAAEMRDRIRKVFQNQKNQDCLRRLDSSPILTIHGLCSRLLREKPLEFEVDPQFSILDEYTASVLLEEATEESVANLIDQTSDTAASLIAGYGRVSLINQIKKLYLSMRSLGEDDFVDLESMTRRTLKDIREVNSLISQLNTENTILKGIGDQLPKTATKAKVATQEYTDGWNSFSAQPISVKSNSFDLISQLENLLEKLPDARTKAIKPSVYKIRELINSLIRTLCDLILNQQLPDIMKVLEELHVNYSKAKNDRYSLDYDDLQLKVRNGLRKNPELQKFFANRYTHWLIDEFQDTNELQREILNLITEYLPENGSFFVVGDLRQSIYAFRGARVEVFDEHLNMTRNQNGLVVNLVENFRSKPELIEFYNQLFSQVMRYPETMPQLEARSVGCIEYQPMVSNQPTQPGEKDHPAVEYIRIENTDDTVDPRELEAQRIAIRIQNLIQNKELQISTSTGKREAIWGDIALLLPTFLHSKVFEKALREHKIPYSVISGRGFYARPEIRDILSLLDFLDNTTNEIALAAVLRSPFFGLSDEGLIFLRYPDLEQPNTLQPLWQAVRTQTYATCMSKDDQEVVAQAALCLTKWLELKDRVSLSEYIALILTQSQYEVVSAAHLEDGPQRIANIEKICNLARGFEKKTCRSLSDFVFFVKEYQRLEVIESEGVVAEEVNAVQILTIHKSKGLEWPIVIVADLDQEQHSKAPAFLFDPSLGIAWKVADSKGQLYETELGHRIQTRRKSREEFEALRKLYVAVTRAEYKLILAGHAASSTKSWLTLIDEVFPEGTLSSPVLQPLTTQISNPTNPELSVGDFLSITQQLCQPVKRESQVIPGKLISVSQMTAYIKCPRKCWYQRVLRLEGPGSNLFFDDETDIEFAQSKPPRGICSRIAAAVCANTPQFLNTRDSILRVIDSIRRVSGFGSVIHKFTDEEYLSVLEYPVQVWKDSKYNAQLQKIRDTKPFHVIEGQDWLLNYEEVLLSGRIDLALQDFYPGEVTLFEFQVGPHISLEAQLAKMKLRVQTQVQAFRKVCRFRDQMDIIEGEELTQPVSVVVFGLDETQGVRLYKLPKNEFSQSACEAATFEAITKLIKMERQLEVQPETNPGKQCRTCCFQAICPDALVDTDQTDYKITQL